MWKVWALLGGVVVVLSVIAYGLSLGQISEPWPDEVDAPALAPWAEPGAPWLQPAGTPIAAGVAVPEGSSMVGPVFSTLAKSGGDDWQVSGQSAFLLAPSGIESIAHDLADQAAPPRFVPMNRGDLCVQNIAVDKATEPADYSGTLDPMAVTIECGGYQQGGPGLDADLRQDVTQQAPVQGHLRWFAPPDLLPSSLPRVPHGVQGPSSVPSGVEGEPDLQIENGSFLAGPPGWGSLTGGYTAVIGVRGDPDQVFDAYVDDEVKPHEVDATVKGMHVRTAEWGGAGGVSYRVTLNELDGNAWILVEAYND